MASKRRRVQRSNAGYSVTRPGRTIAVTVPYPVSAKLSRTVTYPYPKQIQRTSKVVRVELYPRKQFYRLAKVTVRMPRALPIVRGSYVSIDRNRLNIHSKRQLRRLLDAEYNRRRYNEHKSNRRKARNGQLDSVRSDRLGMLAEAQQRGWSARRLADVAMVSRALGAS